MDARTCKLCLRRFSNGHALGGHMRSHFAAAKQLPRPPSQMLDDSTPTSSFSYEAEPPAGERKVVAAGYGLRENPRKSCRLVDLEFSSVTDYHVFLGGGAVVDGESETESSILVAPASSRRRSKRQRRCSPVPGKPEVEEVEPVSSVSDTTQEEDAALWLMMLSRDAWKRKAEYPKEEEEEEYQSEATGEDLRSAGRSSRRARYRCDLCNKVFWSYQALDVHSASHKKVRPPAATSPTIVDADDDHHRRPILEINPGSNADPMSHECPVCFRVFDSAKALDGHKITHLSSMLSNTAATPANNISPSIATSKSGVGFIDLNLPAPMEESDGGSKFELSAVS